VGGLGEHPVYHSEVSFFASFSFFFDFFGSCTGHTARQSWTNEGSKRVDPHKDVSFGSLNNVPLNLGTSNPPKNKLKLWGRKWDLQA